MKSNVSKLPQAKVEPGNPVHVPADAEILPAAESNHVSAVGVNSVIVEVPFTTELGSKRDYQDDSSRLDLGKISKDQLRKVKAWRRGLVNRDASLKNGRAVKSNRDAVLWVIDNAEF